MKFLEKKEEPVRSVQGRSVLRGMAAFFSGAVLLLMPKCPACLAGYLAIGSGLGVSLTFAEGLRVSLLLIGASVLLCFIVKRVCSFARRICYPRRN